MARCFSGQQLRDARIAAGLRPEQLAVRIDRSVYSVHEYERGRVQPPIDVLLHVCAVLDCTVDDLLAGEAVGSVA